MSIMLLLPPCRSAWRAVGLLFSLLQHAVMV
jgi:hypothetical protein